MLRRRGIQKVRPLEGGLEAWRDHGLPLISDTGELKEASPLSFTTPPASNLADSVVLDESGQSVAMRALWQERPTVIVFVRQFGCMLCRDLVLSLRDHVDTIRECGGELVLVGNGDPESAGRFRALFDLDFPVYVDPQRHIYELLGFKRNLGGSANPAVLLMAARAWLRGARQGATQGDPWQLGGVIVVGIDGEIAYRHSSRFAGDHPKLDAIVAAIDS